MVLGAVAAILILRARAFRDRRHAIILVAIAVTALIGAAAQIRPALRADRHLRDAGSRRARRSGIAAAGLVAATWCRRRVFSPPVRKVVEYTEYLLLALVVPFAAWAIGLLQYIRYH